MSNIKTAEIDEGVSPTQVSRIEAADGTAIQQADVAGTSGQEISLKIFDTALDDPSGNPLVDVTLDKTAVIFDTLQTDGYWDQDATGYNFRHTQDGSLLTKGGHVYLLEYQITLTSSRGIVFVRQYVKLKAVKGS